SPPPPDPDAQCQPAGPPPNASGARLPTELPRAVELRLQHRRYGELRRLLRLPDLPAQNAVGAPPEDSNEVPQS
ncbi:MAG: type II secretion system protein GspJ, partial [Pseudomonadaceae bacterium]